MYKLNFDIPFRINLKKADNYPPFSFYIFLDPQRRTGCLY